MSEPKDRIMYDENFTKEEKNDELLKPNMENKFFQKIREIHKSNNYNTLNDTPELPEKEKALRYNKGKLELSQCAAETIAAIATVFQKNSERFGGKYPDGNWKKGAPYSELIGCLERHLAQFKTGVDIDEESGLPHLFLAAANIQMLIFTMMNHPEFDDRDKRFPINFKKFTKYLKQE